MTRLRVASVVGTILLIGSCAGVQQPSPPPEFGAGAVAWREARYLAARAGVPNLPRFYDEDVVVEDRVTGSVLSGREAFLSAYSRVVLRNGGGTSDPAVAGILLLSADEMLDQFFYPDVGPMPWTPAVEDWMLRATVGRRGFTHVTTAASIEYWRTQVVRVVPGLERFPALADRYVALWAGEPGVDVTDVYAPGASIEDTLTGSSAQGLDQVGRAVGSGEWPDVPPMRVVTLPDVKTGGAAPAQPPRGRAIYIAPALAGTQELSQMVVLVESADASGCPGVVGIAMAVEKGRVLWERRYHEVASVRRCFDTGTLEPGWWAQIEVPEPVRHELTGTVRVADGRSVEVYNGTPAMDDFVAWGLGRFADAGLGLPDVGSVTFLADESQCGNGRNAFSRPTADGVSVSLCFQPEQVCDEDCPRWAQLARLVLLHELAHAWIDDNVDDAARRAYMNLVGVARWSDSRDAWADRGVERAATTLANGLFDEQLTTSAARCAELVDGFRLLTGTDPPAVCAS